MERGLLLLRIIKESHPFVLQKPPLCKGRGTAVSGGGVVTIKQSHPFGWLFYCNIF